MLKLSSQARYRWIILLCGSIYCLTFCSFFIKHISWSSTQVYLNHHRVGDRIYSDELSSLGNIVQTNRFFSLTGFNFCHSLDNSIFDSSTYVYKLNNTVMGANPNKNELINLIDGTASFNFNFMLNVNEKLPQEQLRSFCCYAAAEGSRPMFNITKSRFLSSIDPTVYFKKQLPNLRPSNNDMIYKKKFG